MKKFTYRDLDKIYHAIEALETLRQAATYLRDDNARKSLYADRTYYEGQLDELDPENKIVPELYHRWRCKDAESCVKWWEAKLSSVERDMKWLYEGGKEQSDSIFAEFFTEPRPKEEIEKEINKWKFLTGWLRDREFTVA